MSTSSFTDTDLDDFLNRMLEAERAGARALVVFLDGFPRNGAAWKTLRRVHESEAHNCALLDEQLKKRGKDTSHATGEFYTKAVAVRGRRQRIEFLLRGLGWAVREFDRAMPRVDDPRIRTTLARMRETHARSIEACGLVAKTLED